MAPEVVQQIDVPFDIKSQLILRLSGARLLVGLLEGDPDFTAR